MSRTRGVGRTGITEVRCGTQDAGLNRCTARRGVASVLLSCTIHMGMYIDPGIQVLQTTSTWRDNGMTESRMRAAAEAANAAILILRTITGRPRGDQPVIVFEGERTSEPMNRLEAVEYMAALREPLALVGDDENGTLIIHLTRPSVDQLRFLDARARKSTGDDEFFGVVPRRCLGPGNQIQLIGIDTLTISAEAYMKLQTAYVISPNYSLSGDEPVRSASPPSVCWAIRISAGGIGITLG